MADQYDVVVCGDSFCCATTVDLVSVGSRAHFSQILEDRWGYRVLNLAHGGVSNTCILWQMREALSLAPKTIIYNRTFEGRIDLMLNDLFTLERGLRNWAYWQEHQTSYRTPHTSRIDDQNLLPSVISSVYQGLAENPCINLNDHQLHAVDAWLTHFFNWEMFREMNNWHFEFWHGRILDAGSQPLPFNHESVGALAWRFSEIYPDFDSPFHTDRATQEKIAENVHELIQDGTTLDVVRSV